MEGGHFEPAADELLLVVTAALIVSFNSHWASWSDPRASALEVVTNDNISVLGPIAGREAVIGSTVGHRR